MGQPIEGRNRELLEAKNFCHVGTIRADGTPHLTPVWVDVDGDVIVLNSARGRAWPTNIERDPRVELNVMNLENPYEYVSIRGRAVEVTEDGAGAHIDKLAFKYLGQDTYPYHQPGDVRVIIRIEADRIHHNG
jgi:PPOX class probable F420-dependent enzyme